MADEMQTSVTVEWIDTTDEPFRPEQATEIFATLEPEEAYDATFFPPSYTDFYGNYVVPPRVDYKDLPDFEAPPAELIINIETTATVPWEGRLITIGVLDPNKLELEVSHFFGLTEEETLQQFIDWFTASGYTKLVGYNASFDYRWIYVLCQKYRKEFPVWKGLDIYDLMQQQKQVKSAFVYGFNKTGKLEDWGTYLLGAQPYAPQDAVYKWFKEGNVEEILAFNADKLLKSYNLWVLDKLVDGKIPGAGVLGRPGLEETETPEGSTPSPGEVQENMLEVTCSECHDVQLIPKSVKVINCRVCGTPIAHPSA